MPFQFNRTREWFMSTYTCQKKAFDTFKSLLLLKFLTLILPHTAVSALPLCPGLVFPLSVIGQYPMESFDWHIHLWEGKIKHIARKELTLHVVVFLIWSCVCRCDYLFFFFWRQVDKSQRGPKCEHDDTVYSTNSIQYTPSFCLHFLETNQQVLKQIKLKYKQIPLQPTILVLH